MEHLIEHVNILRNISNSELNLNVKRVAVILTSPRSGSSLVKSVLASHPDIVSLDGEIEPFLTLTKNGFGYTSDSDAIETLSNRKDLVNNVLDGLTIRSRELPTLDILQRRWERRLLLQFPQLFVNQDKHNKVIEYLRNAIFTIPTCGAWGEKYVQRYVLASVFQDDPWRIGYYDGYASSVSTRYFNQFKIEEPPFIVPTIYGAKITGNDVQTKTLLFKSTADAYRIGMYGQLFPNAHIKFIHLTRGYAQTVNGLMDGWLSETGFFSHNMKDAGVRLNIKGYSDSVQFGKIWWKFNLPPNWREFISTPLESVCLNQWMFAHNAILESKLPNLRVSFEEILLDSNDAIRKITDYLDLQELRTTALPVVMAIETPRSRRWLKRERQLLTIGKQATIRETMTSLGYEMNPETWL